MCSDIERLGNLIVAIVGLKYNILIKEGLEIAIRCNEIKTLEEYKSWDNQIVKDAIKEILETPRWLNKIKEDTNFSIEELKEIAGIE